MWPSPTDLFFFFFFIVWRNPIDAKLFWNLNLFVFAAARLNWRHTICAPQQLLDCPVLSVFVRCARCGGGDAVCGYVSTWPVSTTYVAWRGGEIERQLKWTHSVHGLAALLSLSLSPRSTIQFTWFPSLNLYTACNITRLFNALLSLSLSAYSHQ